MIDQLQINQMADRLLKIRKEAKAENDQLREENRIMREHLFKLEQENNGLAKLLRTVANGLELSLLAIQGVKTEAQSK